MKFRNKKVYCVGNAHLDPVWMWRWQEGSCESKATIRSALDRMKEYPDFVFVCAAGQVFEWIEKFDPDMFAEIQQRVKEGRFVITGGWFVQPDCNLPSGESFVRHGLYTQRYFKEKLGVTAKTGYNVDSFGHNVMIPQILKKSGMDNYIFLRPGPHEATLPSHIFRWRSPDGSEVLSGRILVRYNYSAQMTDLPSLENVIAEVEEKADPNMDQMLLFYGVGNHGGGPTKKNIEAIMACQKEHPETELVFSTADDFFQRARTFEEKLPVVTDDLQHHASGCYAAVSSVKNSIRRAECALSAAENFGMMVDKLVGFNGATTQQMKEAWKNVMFAHFHDSMGGCSVKEVHDDTLLSLGESRTMAARMENDALQTLSWKIDTRNSPAGCFPVILFNPHPFDVEQLVQLNNRFDHIYDSDGNELPRQHVHSPRDRCRPIPTDTVFMAKVPAFGYATYYRRRDINTAADYEEFLADSSRFPQHLTAPVPENHPRAEGLVLENDCIRVTFDKHTGYIASIVDKTTDKNMLRGFGAVPVVIDESEHDTWSHFKNFFDKEIARFSDAKIEALESGSVRATIKVTSRYNDSTLVQYFSLLPGTKQLAVRVKLDWHEHRKMLKLRYHTALNDPKAYYEIPYGVIQRPADGEEEPGLMWFAAKDKADGYAILNDSKYSFSVRGNAMDLTAIRSPYYNDHGRGELIDPESELTDQGETEFHYVFMPIEDEGWNSVIRAAKSLNTPCTQIMENNHKGSLPLNYCGIHVSADNVIVGAYKRSEDGTGVILRAYETDGKEAEVTVSGDILSAPLTAKFTPYSINTYYLQDGSDFWKEVMMTEFDFEG